jgi:UDP-2,4-diacetamido-2,4,6-trideoxy-beta-L-altropyranose hydrolase
LNHPLHSSAHVVLRTDASNAIGFGHLRRCLAIADFVARAGGKPVFALGVFDDSARDSVEAAGWDCLELDDGTLFDATTLPGSSLVICDMSHPAAVEDVEKLPGYIAELQGNGCRVVLIDAPLAMCLAAKQPLGVDLLVIPYLDGELQQVQPGPHATAAGLPFAIVDSDYSDAAATGRDIADNANRILVTAGGSDPTGATALCLKALHAITDADLTIRVVVGPAFDQKTRTEIQALAATNRHDTTLLDAPAGLLADMLWCDLALSASGVTKYELACAGTPALLFSIDSDLDAMNSSFRQLGTCKDMGQVADLSPDILASAVRQIRSDRSRRQTMSEAGRDAVDGRGCARMFEALEAARAA